MANVPAFHLLEINLISAQDIAKVSRSMRTYAMAWVHPDRKLTTRIDSNGGTNPTWNDKFVFRVDNKFLQSDTSAVMIEIYALHWFRHVHVGTVRVLVGNLIPPQTRSHGPNQLGMRFVALQVRRPSGRPQGILNIGVTVLDSTMRSLPLYTLLGSAVGFQKLMGQDEVPGRANPANNRGGGGGGGPSNNKGQLRRSLSDKSSVVNGKGTSFVNLPNTSLVNGDRGSIIGLPPRKANNNNNNHNNNNHKSNNRNKKDEMYDKPLSIVDGDKSELGLANLKTQNGKADSVLSYGSSVRRPNKKSPSSVASQSNVGVPPLIKQINKNYNNNNINQKQQPNFNNQKQQLDSRYHRGYPVAKDFAAGSVWSESEVGPSPSEVAAAIAEDSKYRQYDEVGSSLLEYNQSEGVGTKLERWRREMPHVYDTQSSDGNSSIFAGNRHRRRHTDGGDVGNGKFRCFGNICGYECTIVCGNNTSPHMRKKRGRRGGRAPSLDSMSTYF